MYEGRQQRHFKVYFSDLLVFVGELKGKISSNRGRKKKAKSSHDTPICRHAFLSLFQITKNLFSRIVFVMNGEGKRVEIVGNKMGREE